MFDQRDEIQEKRLQHQLEMQSMQIEHVFNRHKVDAHVAGGTVKPRLISFNLQTQLATGLERLKVLTDDLMYTLGVPVSLSREDGQLRLHVSQPDLPPVSLLDLMSLLVELPPITAVLGLAEDGRPVLLDFSEQGMTHILVSGVSGAGKTALLRSLAISLALMNRQSRVQFVILDGSSPNDGGATLPALDYLPHMLTSVICHPDDIRETLSFLMSEVSYRLEYEVAAPTILVMIDEVVTLLEGGEGLVRDAIRFLAQRGADVGVHLVMSTQRPQSAVLDNLLKANISVQIVGRLADSEQAVTTTGLQGSQAEFLLGQGDFLAIAGQYMTHFQAAYIGDYDLHMTLRELHRNRPPALLAQTVAEYQTISLSTAHLEDVTDELPQHFVFSGDAISLHYDELPKVSLMVELEENLAEEDEAEEVSYVPQPVIRLFHNVQIAEDAAVDEGEEDEEVETADFPSITDAEEFSPSLDSFKIYHALSQAQHKPNYEWQSQNVVSEKGVVDYLLAEQSDLLIPEEDEAVWEAVDIEEIVHFDEIDTQKMKDAGDAESEAEYETFDDDWLPFDDE